MNIKSGYYIVTILVLIALALWSLNETFPYKFIAVSDGLTSLGQIAGLIGMVLFAVSLALSARLKVFEYFFGGMNDVYIAHHTFGGIGFLFLLIHPLFLASSFIQSSWTEAALFILPGNDWAINAGITALLLLMALLILTYYVELPYQIWRYTHQFLGLVLFIGGLHVYFITSDVSHNLPLRYYVLTLCALGLTLYIYRTLLGRFLVPKYIYEISQVRHLSNTVTELTLIPQGKALRYLPGQFVFISFPDATLPNESHPFSISSASDQGTVRISVKALGDYTSLLKNLPEKSTVFIEGPFGRFIPQVSSRKQIWIAGGIGITPFVSMASVLADTSINVDLYYTVRNQSDALYLDELTSLATHNQGFHIIMHLSGTSGHLTAKYIKQISGDLSDADIYICGPPSLMISLKSQLRKIGVQKYKIHTEAFEIN